MLRNLFELWRQHPQFMVVIVDKMLKTQIVECCAVANWIFSRDMALEFTRSYIWEILHLTIRKMSKHVIRLEKEVVDARAKLKSMPSDSESSEDDGVKGSKCLYAPFLVYYFISFLFTEKRRRAPPSTGSSKDEDKPTEEAVERMEEKLESAQSDQKNLFLIIFQV